jgi:heat shock protein HslJ
MGRMRAVVVLIGTLMIASLSPASVLAQDGAVADQDLLEGTEWVLSSYAGTDGTLAAVPSEVAASLLLEAGSAGGSGGCNTFSTTYAVDADSITIGGADGAMAVTEAICEGAPQEVEDAYLALLPQVATWSLVDGALEMADASGATTLAFADGMISIAVSEYLAITGQLDTQAAAIAGLIVRVANLERSDSVGNGSSGDGSSGGSTKATKPKGPRVAGEVERQFAEQGADPERGLVAWEDRADDESGYNVHARRIQCVRRKGNIVERPSDWVRIDRVAADTEQYRPVHADVNDNVEAQITDPLLGRGALYEVAVSAFNDAGKSKKKLVGAYFTTPEYGCP